MSANINPHGIGWSIRAGTAPLGPDAGWLRTEGDDTGAAAPADVHDGGSHGAEEEEEGKGPHLGGCQCN